MVTPEKITEKITEKMSEKTSEKITEKVTEATSALSISDWVTFLGNEKVLNLKGLILNVLIGLVGIFIAFLTIMVALYISEPFKWWYALLWIAAILVVYGFIYFTKIKNIQVKDKQIRDILTDIMKGNLDNPEKIRKAWEETIVKIT